MHAVTYFSGALNEALQGSNSNRTLLAKAVNLDPSQVSRYCNGTSLPKVDTLESILRQFPLQYQLLLMATYLKDNIPSVISDKIHVRILESDCIDVGVAQESLLKLPEDIRAALFHLRIKALTSPSVRQMLLTVAKVAEYVPSSPSNCTSEQPVAE